MVYLVVFAKCGWLLKYMLVFLVKKRTSVVMDAKFRGIIHKQQVEVKSRSLDTECKSRERMKKEMENEHNVSRSLSAEV